jgi:hypothetical protein
LSQDLAGPRLVAATRPNSPRVVVSYEVLYANSVALFGRRARSAWGPCLPLLFPRSPFPSASRQKFILLWSKSLTESLTTSWPPGPSVGSTSLSSPVPSTTSLGLAPYEAARHSRLGSALRLSQPLSGFLANPSFVALFRATAVRGIPPFRGFPSQVIADPSRGSLAPLQFSTDVRGRVSFDRSPVVSPTPTRWRGCLVPPTAMSSLLARRSVPPGRPGSRATNSARSVSVVCFEASIPPASPFTIGSGFPSPIGRSSPGFLPL